MAAFQNKKQQIHLSQFSAVAFSKYFNEISKRKEQLILKAAYTRKKVYCDKDC